MQKKNNLNWDKSVSYYCQNKAGFKEAAGGHSQAWRHNMQEKWWQLWCQDKTQRCTSLAHALRIPSTGATAGSLNSCALTSQEQKHCVFLFKARSKMIILGYKLGILYYKKLLMNFTFMHLADGLIQSDLQRGTKPMPIWQHCLNTHKSNLIWVFWTEFQRVPYYEDITINKFLRVSWR